MSEGRPVLYIWYYAVDAGVHAEEAGVRVILFRFCQSPRKCMRQGGRSLCWVFKKKGKAGRDGKDEV